MPPTATESLIFLYLVVSVILLLLVPSSLQAVREEPRRPNEVVCSNIDIRNKVENFRKLENCTVVEGFVKILLLNVGGTREFESLSFPKLREITDYLLFYRTFGLLSLERLFPNLAVIRGRTLFFNYALVVFEMFQLQEIGLRSLTDIVRGSVRIEKNPNLCYVATVDWDRIARKGAGENFIKENKHPSTCPTCSSQGDCPLSSSTSGKPTYLCWNSHLCQKVCTEKCLRNDLACDPRSGECCHKECLGGCSGPYNTNCTACRNVAYEGRCLKKCPTNTFEYMERRCIREDQCKNMSHFVKTDAPPVFFKPFKGHCKPHCPTGYTENASNPYHCIPCKDSCPKVCLSAIVNSVSSAQKLKGCTYINGSLQIQITGGKNVVHELEKNLNTIQEIRGFLKIIRSYPIKSLNFLKELTVIHGEILEQDAYSLFVLDNQNLQELWDWENRKKRLLINKGKVFFHFNSKLCPEKINELKRYADVKPWDDRDVSPNSNGDRVACQVFNMNLTFIHIASELVLLSWDNFRKNMTDPRNLLNYIVYYKEAPEQNITIFDGRDACGDDVWKVNDVEVTGADKIYHLITHLKPFTQYAIYIQTYTLASAGLGAQSNIHYVRTHPDTPSPPQSISAHSTSSSNIVISWLSPKRPNGIVTHYQVNVIQETDSSEFINKRNYCIDPLNLPDIKNIMEEEEANAKKHGWTNGTSRAATNSTDNPECCSCRSKTNLDDGEVAQSQVVFEDYLHNMVYIRNPEANKFNRSRSSNSSLSPKLSTSTTTSSPVPTSALDMTTLIEEEITHGLTTASALSSHPQEEGSLSNQTDDSGDRSREGQGRRITLKVSNDTMRVIPNLRHFTEYTIEVMACLDEIPNPNKSKCSTKAITSVRTLPLGKMDDIDMRTIEIVSENATKGMVTIHWKEPVDPNGLIVSYTIEYKKADGDGHKPIKICMPRLEYQTKSGYSLTGLSPGNYSLIIRTTSLAGNGNWTQPVYITIPQARNNLSTEIIVVVTLAFFIVVFLILGAIYIRKKRFSIPEEIIYASINPEYMSTGNVYKPDEWEVAREKINLLRELGQGSFGMVYEGEARDLVPGQTIVPCAVKTVNDNATYKERLDFLMEASVMKAFDCHHVVKLLGVVSQSHPTLVIMELMSNGDLKSYLRSHRPDNEEFPDRQPPTLKRILQMAAEIADGMSYLAFNKFVHRDLAARNCMVAHDLTVKIGDFGMTRDIYETDYYRKGGKGLLPVRWMAPESLKDGVFTSSSDVWSYGVVLWEMATLASQPYQGFSNEQVLQYVLSEGYMPQPENCPERLYSLMLLCWKQKPSERPTFEQIIDMLLPDVSQKFLQVSFYVTREMERSAPLAEDEVEASPSTPLRSHSLHSSPGENAGVDEACEGSEVRFFPNSALDSSPDEVEPRVVFHTTSEGSKGFSSEGSKGSSKGSSNNGSLANGHVPRTTSTMC